MAEFTGVGDRVWVARHDWFDANVTVIGGERGLLVVDTHGSTAAGRVVVDDVRRLGAGDVVGVVNTHWHFDHTFGNEAIREAWGDVQFTAHEDAAAELAGRAEEIRRRYAEAPEDPHSADVMATTVLVPSDTFTSSTVIDLGDRAVELVHPGRGHTAGDLVVRVRDADVLLAGDLVEESAPPSYGSDCFPLAWPPTLDTVLGLLTADTVVVPGHGAPVNRGFVEQQREHVGLVALAVRDLAARGVPAAEALAATSWPWDPALLQQAVTRGYEQLSHVASR